MLGFEEPSFDVGMEEEYFIVKKADMSLIKRQPYGFFDMLSRSLKKRVKKELFQAQMEINTSVHTSTKEMRKELKALRLCASRVVNEFSCEIMAASSHPFADWHTQEYEHVKEGHYGALVNLHKMLANRMLVCGMHVHVAVENNDLRLMFMNYVRYFVPFFIALTCSSPFWCGRDTGLQSYRVSIMTSLPRSGLPDLFSSHKEYKQYTNLLCANDLIDESSEGWWDVRMSYKYPTLELRATEMCASIEDAVGVAALYRCILRMLFRLISKKKVPYWVRCPSCLIKENRWIAQRYGLDYGFIDFEENRVLPSKHFLNKIIKSISEDIDYFNCRSEIKHVEAMVEKGNCASRQLNFYKELGSAGTSIIENLRSVTSMLVNDTVKK